MLLADERPAWGGPLALLSMVASFLRPDRISGISWLSCHVPGIYSIIADLS